MVNDLVTLDTESRQGDFAVTIKVRNGRLLSVLRAAGFRSINAFCKKNGMSNNVIGAYVTLTRSPIQSVGENAGQPTKAALDIADRLGVRVEDMFPVGFLARCLARVANATEIPMTAGQIAMLIQEPPRTPEDIIALDEAAARISDTMVLLPPRHERFLRMRLGMGTPGGAERTLQAIAEEVDLSRAAVDQIEQNAVLRLSRPHAKSRLAGPARTLGINAPRLAATPRGATAQEEAGVRVVGKDRGFWERPLVSRIVARPRKLRREDFGAFEDVE
jgi:hypothetical protein